MTYSASIPAAANAALCMTTECRRRSGLPRRATRRVTGGSRRDGDRVAVGPADGPSGRREGHVRDDLADPSLELDRVRGDRVQDELLDPRLDPGLERRDNLVRGPEEIDRLEVARAALAAHHLEECPVLLLACPRRVVRQHEMQEVLVGDRQLARILAVLAEVHLELVPVAPDVG